jgi:hypothetical protein
MKAPKRAAKVSNPLNLKNIEVKKDSYVVGTLVALNLIGEDDAFDSEFYRTSVKCVSQTAELYEIKTASF